jgi:hypothetical protein
VAEIGGGVSPKTLEDGSGIGKPVVGRVKETASHNASAPLIAKSARSTRPVI